jgi:hypothetical protein
MAGEKSWSSYSGIGSQDGPISIRITPALSFHGPR